MSCSIGLPSLRPVFASIVPELCQNPFSSALLCRNRSHSHSAAGSVFPELRASSEVHLRDHAVPTREYQSDQSSRMLLGCHRPCCPTAVLKAHQRERVPAPPPVEAVVDARTVLRAVPAWLALSTAVGQQGR